MVKAWRVRGGELPRSRTLVDPELHYDQISTIQKDGTPPFPRRNAHSRTLYSAWSLLLDAQSSCVVLLVVLGLVRCLRWDMATKLGRSQLHVRPVGGIFLRPNVTLSNTSPAMSRRSSVVSWSDSPRDQVRPASQCCILLVSLLQVSTPSSLVGLETRVDCAVSHGFGKSVGKGTLQTPPAQLAWSQPFVGTHSAQVGHPGVESVSRASYFSAPSKPVSFSSGLEVSSEHAGISAFSAESSAPLQGTSCVDRAVSHGFDGAMSGGVGTQYAHVGYPGVELVSLATYISRKKRNLESVQRHSKALKKVQRDAKLKFIAQPEMSHEAAELILKKQAARTDEKFPGTLHVSHHLALLHGHENVFLYTVWCRQRWWSFEATEVSMRRIWPIPSESKTQA